MGVHVINATMKHPVTIRFMKVIYIYIDRHLHGEYVFFSMRHCHGI